MELEGGQLALTTFMSQRLIDRRTGRRIPTIEVKTRRRRLRWWRRWWYRRWRSGWGWRMWNKWHGANDCCHRSRNPVYSMLQHLINSVIAECDLNTKSRNTPCRRDCNLVENQPCLEHISPGRIDPIHWITADIEILVQRLRIDGFSVFRIAAEESACRRIVVSGAEVVEAQVGVVLFAATERPNAISSAARPQP